jgi:aspartate racemase
VVAILDTMPKHIGIVAVTSEGAALCYRTICQEGEIQSGYAHPQVSLHNFPLSEYMRSIEAEDWPAVGRLLLESAERLQRTGAAIAICPDNTAHQGLDLVRHQSPIPWLHIAEEIASVAAAAGYRKVGLLGTRWLMEGPVYTRALAAHGIACEIPESDVRQRISAFIMDELVFGRFAITTREYFEAAIQVFKRNGCDAVVLGCTEIPLLIQEEHSVLPILDSTRTLARAALREAVKRRAANP